jgi:hypothetical protein
MNRVNIDFRVSGFESPCLELEPGTLNSERSSLPLPESSLLGHSLGHSITAPPSEFHRIWKISFQSFSYFGNSLTSSIVSM